MLQIPLEEAPEVGLIIEVNSSQSQALPASTTMHLYEIEGATFPGMQNVTVYFEGQEGSKCFSTSNQISEFSVSIFCNTKLIIVCIRVADLLTQGCLFD